MGRNNVRATGGEEHCETLSSKYDMACIIKKKEEQKEKVIKAIEVKRLATI